MLRLPIIICTVLFVFTAVVNSQAQSTDSNRGVVVAGGPTPSFRNIYALVVGVSSYKDKNIGDLSYADDDARLFYTYLLAAYPQQIKPGVNIRLLIDNEATTTAITQGLTWLRDQANENDLVLFFFAGHGAIDVSGLDQGQAYLLPADSNPADLHSSAALRMPLLDKILNQDIAIGKKATTLCILDACHAGKSNSNRQNEAGYINQRLSEKQSNVIKILASRGQQLASEDPALCGGHGVFTYFLIKGLLKEADKNGDKKISLTEMEQFLPSHVRQATKESQNPVVQYEADLVLNGWQGGSTDDFNCLLDQKTQTASPVAYATYDERQLTANQLNETQKRHYEQFTKALAEQRFLAPANNNVLHYFEVLREDRVDPKILSQIQNQWKGAFQDYGQELILAYLQERPIQNYTDYEKAGLMMQRVLDVSTPSEDGYNLLKARQIWLASYSQSRKIDLGFYRNSQNEQRKQRVAIVADIRRAIELDPKAAYLYNTLGRNLEKIGKDEEAKDAYRKAIELAPRWTYPRNNLSLTLTDIDEKIKLLEECIQLNPNMALAYGNLAIRHLDKNDTLRCRQYLDQALSLCQRQKDALYRYDIAWIYQQYAALYKKRDNRQKAEYYYKQAVENSDPDDIDSRLSLAGYYCDLYETNKVDELLNGMMAQWANDARPYATLGYKYFHINDWPNAIRYYQQAIDRDSMNAYYHEILSITYRQLKKYDLALQHITTAIRLDPTESAYLSERGNVWQDQQKYDQALADHRQALKLNPKSAFTYGNLGRVYLNKKEYSEAERLLRQAVTLEGNDAYYHYLLGYILYKQTRNAEALAEYRRGLRYSPAWNDLWTSICDVYRSMNQLDSAVYALNQGVELSGLMKDRKYKEAREKFLETISQNDNIFSYYALGYMHEKGFGVPVNLPEAVRWYQYATQLGSAVAAHRLIQLIESKRVRIDHPDKEIARLRKNIEKGWKNFTIPAQLADGNKVPVNLVIEDFPADPNEPIAHELRRIREVRKATMAQEVIDAFGKLYGLATKNNVSYQDLCEYALNAANEEKLKTTARAVNYPAKALEVIQKNQLDSLNSYMRQSVITYLGVDLNSPETSAKKLLDSLRNGTSQPGLYYYALGYLYEHKPSGRSWAKAENYYRYAFQAGYAPAYYRLITRYTREIPSTSQANWLRDNYNRGFNSFTVTGYLPDSSSRKLTLYVHDFPQDPRDPIGDERQRLRDIFGATLSATMIQRFSDLYKESAVNRRSFREQCDLAVSATSQNTAPESNDAASDLIKQADILLEQTKYSEAIKLYVKAIERTTDKALRAENWVKLGNALMLKKAYSEAQSCYKLSLSLNPSGWAYYCSGYSYAQQTKYDSAAIRYQQAIELNPSRANYHRELGRSYYELKNYPSAIKALTRSRQLDSTNTQTLNTLAISLTYAKRYEDGLACLRQAIELNPSSAEVYMYNMACNYALQGKSAEALKYLEEAIKRKYDNYESINQDPDLVSLRKMDGYRQLMAKYFPGKK